MGSDEAMPGKLRIRLMAGLRQHAPREMVGFVIYPWDLVFVRNVAKNLNQFEVADEVQIQVYETYGSRLKGIFHSHPNGRRTPSLRDAEYAPIGMRYWIITPSEVIEWDMDYDPPIERVFGASGTDLASPATARGAEDGR